MKVRIAVAPGTARLDPAFVDGLEALGFDTVWLSDVPMADVTDPLLGLALAAGRTTRLKLGANVVPIGRNPFLLAKELAQLDQLSGGRVLLSLVPGLDQPGERQILGGVKDRGAFIDALIPKLRAWWAGEEVDGVRLPSTPVQDPLELWLGGMGPKALDRVGRMADGWLGAALGPKAAGEARRTIDEAAAAHGRSIDPEHHGLSIPYARREPDPALVAGLLKRNPDADPAELFPVGAPALRDLLGRYVDEGISKFVVRASHPVTDWDEELRWLADAVLDFQT